MQNRGRQHTPVLAAQERDFSGLRYDKITPTDIDCCTDFGGHLLVFTEAKLPGIELPSGQRLFLERVVDGLASKDRSAIGIVCEHPNRVGVIDFATCRVVMYRWKKAWRFPPRIVTVRQATDATLKLCNLAYYIGKTS